MSSKLSLSCPAKINLFLEVRGKRADGFHEIGTLFQAVEAGDTLAAEPWDSLVLAGAEGVTENPDDNLVLKAARLLRDSFPDRVATNAGIRFALEKRVPAGAGLGGGSSDAAAALRLANAVWKAGLGDDALRALAAELGSDVPFFLSSATAFGESRGEALTPAPAPHPFHVVIATPRCHVNTGWAYGELSRLRGGRFGAAWLAFKARYAANPRDPSLYASLHNDFEEPVMGEYSEIRDLRDALRAHAPVAAMLSGSGASVFALFTDEAAAEAAKRAVAPMCRYAIRTRFLDRLPAL
ncbi:MAG TPA: 4-(cytidine 5'-diphospho)-2-C-methyl-D-erythritol kinase [Fibrobacteria bacterium]|nr:4-(cytidine 5'-diphospho)-2-C-methyl-D-erythritol kinase [Fibrobacteria bacterium]